MRLGRQPSQSVEVNRAVWPQALSSLLFSMRASSRAGMSSSLRGCVVRRQGSGKPTYGQDVNGAALKLPVASHPDSAPGFVAVTPRP